MGGHALLCTEFHLSLGYDWYSEGERLPSELGLSLGADWHCGGALSTAVHGGLSLGDGFYSYSELPRLPISVFHSQLDGTMGRHDDQLQI